MNISLSQIGHKLPFLLLLLFLNQYMKISCQGEGLVTWNEAVRRCNTSSDEPLYLPGFSDEEFQEAGEYMNKPEITSMWINLKYNYVFVWNNGSVYEETIYKDPGDCGIIREGIIQAVDCNIERYFGCDKNGMKLCCEETVSWDEAEENCKKNGAVMLMKPTMQCFRGYGGGGEWIGLRRKWKLVNANKKTEKNYMNPEISKIESLCSNMTGAEGCALLATNKTPGTTPRCRFASCSEKHSYTCSTSVATSITNQPTEETTERPGKKNHTQTTQQTGVEPAEVRMKMSNLNMTDEQRTKDVTEANKTTEEPVKQTQQAQTTLQTEIEPTENKMETSNMLDDKQRTTDVTQVKEITEKPQNKSQVEEITEKPQNISQVEETTEKPQNESLVEEITEKPQNKSQVEEITEKPQNESQSTRYRETETGEVQKETTIMNTLYNNQKPTDDSTGNIWKDADKILIGTVLLIALLIIIILVLFMKWRKEKSRNTRKSGSRRTVDTQTNSEILDHDYEMLGDMTTNKRPNTNKQQTERKESYTYHTYEKMQTEQPVSKDNKWNRGGSKGKFGTDLKVSSSCIDEERHYDNVSVINQNPGKDDRASQRMPKQVSGSQKKWLAAKFRARQLAARFDHKTDTHQNRQLKAPVYVNLPLDVHGTCSMSDGTVDSSWTTEQKNEDVL